MCGVLRFAQGDRLATDVHSGVFDRGARPRDLRSTLRVCSCVWYPLRRWYAVGRHQHVHSLDRRRVTAQPASTWRGRVSGRVPFLLASVGGNVSASGDFAAYKALSSKVTAEKLVGIPEPAPACNGGTCDRSAWAAAVAANPQPINMRLVSITDVLTPAFFPHDGNITLKQANLRSYLVNDYCASLQECGLPTVAQLCFGGECCVATNTTNSSCCSLGQYLTVCYATKSLSEGRGVVLQVFNTSCTWATCPAGPHAPILSTEAVPLSNVTYYQTIGGAPMVGLPVNATVEGANVCATFFNDTVSCCSAPPPTSCCFTSNCDTEVVITSNSSSCFGGPSLTWNSANLYQACMVPAGRKRWTVLLSEEWPYPYYKHWDGGALTLIATATTPLL